MELSKRIVGVLFVVLLCCVFSVCGAVKKSKISGGVPDGVLMTIDGDTIMLSEFVYIYSKNMGEAGDATKTIDDYLELFKVFKLKVHEAAVQGVDTTQSFFREFRQYRAQAAFKYMRDEAALDSLVKVGYWRMSRDRRASHIAVSCPSNASDSVRRESLTRINKIREEVLKDKSRFAQIALEQSEDPNVKQNNGDLGWIRPYRYVYDFEEAVYNTPVGDISEVFTSPFGYHIVKVDEEKKHEEVHAKHIMKIFTKTEEQSVTDSKKKIDSIYALLSAGGDFSELARTESDDKGSSVKGGDIGWFGRGMMVAPFEKVAFQTKVNKISKPFRSDYGWHIIYKMGHRGILPLDSLRKQIIGNIERDERMKIVDSIFVEKTRREYHLPDTMSATEVKIYADKHLEDKYEELRHLVREYHDGIMLFEVSLNEVWNKAGSDTLGLRNYFNQHKDKYVWSAPKYKGYVVRCKDKRVAKLAKKIIKNSIATAPDSVVAFVHHIINVDSVNAVKVTEGLWAQGENGIADRYGFGVKNASFETNDRLPVVFVYGRIIQAPEDYRDEKTAVVSDYQDELEKKWVEELKRKYPIKINKALFDRYKRSIEKSE